VATRAAARRAPRAPADTEGPAVPRLVAGLVARPRLFARLDRAAESPVTLVCAPAGSGKTMLVSSWLRTERADDAVAWIGVERGEADAMRFWGSVMDAVRRSGAIAPDDRLATLAPAPGGGQDEFLRRLLDGLGRIERPLFLVVDDLHELRSEEAIAGLEELLARAPATLRTIVVTRRDPALGLHRLRLEGALTEIRAADLHFSAEEAGELIAGAGVAISGGAVARLHERTEGWAAGLRLAALSLADHDAPERFVAEFSGSERTVADYLLGEVLASQRPEVRDLLLRTCVLERVSGPLADALTGRGDGARVLHALEEANALVVAVDVGRTWFRYHHLLGDLLRLELRREAPAEVPELHRRAALWFAAHGPVVDAIRHAQLGEDWDLATELLGRNWVHLVLDGEEATLAALLAGLPERLAETDAEVATIAAAGRLARSRWSEADALLRAAEAAMAAVPEARRQRAETALSTVELFRARRLGDLAASVDRASALLAGGDGDPADGELTALGLVNLAVAETWTLRLAEAEAHFRRALVLAERAGRPYLEVGCLGGLGVVANLTHRLDVAEDLVRRAIAIAERVGWSTHPVVATPCLTLGAVLIEHGLVGEGAEWIARAEPILADAPEPAASVGLRHTQGMVAVAEGRLADALAAFREGERLTGQLRAPHFLAIIARHWQLRVQVAMGDHEAVRAALGDADGSALWCNAEARLLLAEGDAAGAAAAVAPVVAGEAFVYHPVFEVEALLLDALARTRLGEPDAAERSVERALALTEPQGRRFMFRTIPGVRELLEAHPMHRTAHAGHLRVLLDQLAGAEPAARGDRAAGGAAAAVAGAPLEPLSDRELAVLRFLPTNLSAGEIGGELFLSVHTVKTHMRKLYAKLDVHTRAEAVARGRALGLLAPAPRAG
jgi:LuxR family maltose regulon positive regulatory protein